MTSSLLVDIGNSRIKWRLHHAAGDFDGTVDTGAVDILAERWAQLADRTVDRAFLSNVADEAVLRAVEHTIGRSWPGIPVARVTATHADAGIVNGYADPAQLGSDRWLALIGAHATRPGVSLLVCTFGTATTIDLLRVDEPGGAARFEGGLILPGPSIMHRGLVRATARLPDTPGEVVDFAIRTGDAIASGVVAAQAGAVERSLRQARARLAGRPIELVVAGGAARATIPFIADLAAPCHLVPDLVLRGLAAVARARGAGL